MSCGCSKKSGCKTRLCKCHTKGTFCGPNCGCGSICIRKNGVVTKVPDSIKAPELIKVHRSVSYDSIPDQLLKVNRHKKVVYTDDGVKKSKSLTNDSSSSSSSIKKIGESNSLFSDPSFRKLPSPSSSTLVVPTNSPVSTKKPIPPKAKKEKEKEKEPIVYFSRSKKEKTKPSFSKPSFSKPVERKESTASFLSSFSFSSGSKKLILDEEEDEEKEKEEDEEEDTEAKINLRRNVSEKSDSTWKHRKNEDVYTHATRSTYESQKKVTEVDHVIEIQILNSTLSRLPVSHRTRLVTDHLKNAANGLTNLNVTTHDINQTKRGPFTAWKNRYYGTTTRDLRTRPLQEFIRISTGASNDSMKKNKQWDNITKQMVLTYEEWSDHNTENTTSSLKTAMEHYLDELHTCFEAMKIL